jgi:hypothetical protein
MIKALRKRHIQIWYALAVLIPMGIISAWLVIPKPIRDHLRHPGHSQALPVIIKTVTKEAYSVSLRRAADGSALQLEWINHEPLTAPSALIYEPFPEKGISGLDGAALIGRIDARGIYHFALEKKSWGEHASFILYDIIHHHIIDRINF